MDQALPPTRADYRVLHEMPTRWLDNDIYGHVNNVNYYSFFDTAIAHYLIEEGGLDPWRDPVAKLGRSSVRYEIGIFRADELEASADGHFVHVFVDRASERSAPIPPAIRAALSRLLADPEQAPS
jgi:acyl-CoA thioester hydrolase